MQAKNRRKPSGIRFAAIFFLFFIASVFIPERPLFADPPSILITIPAGNYENTVSVIAGTASYDTGPSTVTLKILNDSSQYYTGSAWQSPEIWLGANEVYASSWSYTGVPSWVDGSSYTVVARAEDITDGWSEVYSTVTFMYDCSSPTSAVTYPVQQVSYQQIVSINGTAHDSYSPLDEVTLKLQRDCDNYSWTGSSWSSSDAWNSVSGTDTWAYDASSVVWDTGTYVCFSIAGDTAGNWEVPYGSATFIITGDTVPPAAVTDLQSVHGASTGTVSLFWTMPGDDGIYGEISGGKYALAYSTYAELWSTATAQVVCSTSSVPGTVSHHVLTELSSGTTYYFRLWTADEAPNWSALSAGATEYMAVDLVPPAAVTDLASTPGAGEGAVLLNWTSPGDDGITGPVTGGKFKIEYATGSVQWQSSGAQIAVSTSVNPGVRQNYSVTGLTNGATYYFRIWNVDECGNISDLSNGTTSYAQEDMMPPAAVTDLEASGGPGEGIARLTWTSPGDNGTSGTIVSGEYRIEYSTYSLAWSTSSAQIVRSTTTLPSITESVSVTGLSGGATYYFRLWTADEALNWSGLSRGATVQVPADDTPPAAVTDLSAVSGASEGTVDMEWTMPGDDSYSGDILSGRYAIQYSSFSVIWSTQSAQVIGSTTTPAGSRSAFTVTGLTGGATYFIRLWVADESLNWSGLSNGATCAAMADIISPSAVSDLQASPGIAEGEVLLSWTMPGDNGDTGIISGGKYWIEYSTYGISWSTLNAQISVSTDTSPGTASSANMSGLAGSTTYYFSVWLEDESRNISGRSNTASVKAQTDVDPPGRVTDLTASPGAEAEINLNWTSPGDDGYTGGLTAGEFLIQYSTFAVIWSSSSAQVVISTDSVPGKLNGTRACGLTPGATYYFRIWSVDESGNCSQLSNGTTSYAGTDIVPPAVSTGFNAVTGDYMGEAELSWVSPGDDGASGAITGGKFAVQYSTFAVAWSNSSAQVVSNYSSSPGAAAETVVTGLTSGATYYFRLWVADNVMNWSGISAGATCWAQVNTYPEPVAELEALSLDGNRAKLSWLKSASDVSVYNIYYSTDKDTMGYDSARSSAPHTAQSWISPALAEGNYYYFSVRTVNARGTEEKNTDRVGTLIMSDPENRLAASIKTPHNGQKISGNSITVMADMVSGNLSDLKNVEFEYKKESENAWSKMAPASAEHPNPDQTAPYFIKWDVSSFSQGQYNLRAVAEDINGTVVSSAAYVTVWIDHADPDISEEVSSTGEHRRTERVYPERPNRLRIGSAKKNTITELDIPEGSVDGEEVKIRITVDPENTMPPGEGHNDIGEYRELSMVEGNLTGEVSLTIYYLDEDEDGYVDGEDIPSDTLKGFWYSSGEGIWKAAGSFLDESSGAVVITTDHFSTFAVFGAPPDNYHSLRAYPNPFRPDAGHRWIKFDFLTANTRLRIFDIAGNMVIDIKDINTGEYIWDVRNGNGADVVSGVYICLFTNSAGKKKIEKIAVIR